MTAPGEHRRLVTGWDVWSLPGRLLGSVLMVELLALVLVVFEVATTPAAALTGSAATGAILVTGGVLHAEISLRVERVRRRIGRQSAQVDLTSVWTFAAVLLLPPAMTSVVVVALYLVAYLRAWRPARTPPYRMVFSTATVLLAAHAAAGVAAHLGVDPAAPLRSALGPLPIVAALVAYTVVNTCLVVGAVVLSSDRTVRELIGHGDEIVVEVATLCLGATVAMAIAGSGPLLAAFALPPLLLLHRAVLVRTLQQVVDIDAKTGLLTAAAWQRQATEQLARVRRGGGSAAVLVIDVDHFKRVNDTYGHLAGDEVLRAVATAVRAEVGDRDLVGRFGGEEFLVLLPRPAGPRFARTGLLAVADRVRRRVACLDVPIPTPDGPLTVSGLSVSIGAASFPGDGGEVQDLVAVADSALYAAKRSGRNTVRLGRPAVARLAPAPSRPRAGVDAAGHGGA